MRKRLFLLSVAFILLGGALQLVAPNSLRRSREAVLREQLFRLRDAIDRDYADNNKYPATLQDLVRKGYLRELPQDPMTESAATWITEKTKADPGNPANPATFDVRSGSKETALDGSQYSEWD